MAYNYSKPQSLDNSKNQRQCQKLIHHMKDSYVCKKIPSSASSEVPGQ